MRTRYMPGRIMVSLCLAGCLLMLLLSSSLAYESSTLLNGSNGEEVRILQQALIKLGFLKGTADGIFGNQTENAVRAFQRKNKLTVDGLAGTKTRELALSLADGGSNPAPVTPAPQITPEPGPVITPEPVIDPAPSGSLFGGNYTTIRLGHTGSRVKLLQQALITAGYLKGKADGVFGNQTLGAVTAFQRSRNLTADGLAGKKTLTALEKAVSGESTPAADPTPAPSPSEPSFPADDQDDINGPISIPSGSSVHLLHWFNDIKPSLSGGQNLLICDPSSGLNWTLRILSRGRHCDAEPLTARDTRTMIKAFGGVNTWNQRAVYVKLPDGRWTIGSTHDMPHDSGTIKDNSFNGHLCVHFLRDMDEARQNDPKYGVANQETIRNFWKQLTGEEIIN